MTNEAQLDHLHSHDEIRQLAARYCWALDTLDRDLLALVFTPDATAHLGRGAQTGVEEIWGTIHSVLSTLDLSQHVVGSQLIDLDDDGNRGSSRCYFNAQHIRKSAEAGSQFIVAGRYEDNVVRTPDGWRIAHRTLTVMWTSGNPAVITP